MVRLFDPHDINRSASTYNLSKLDWLNAHYIKTLPFERIADAASFFGIDFRALPKGEMLLDMLRERSKTLIELKNSAYAILNEPESYDEKAVAKFITPENRELLAKYAATITGDASASEYEERAKAFLEAEGKKLKDLAQPLRIAITGTSVSPGIFEVIEIIGAETLKRRIDKFLAALA